MKENLRNFLTKFQHAEVYILVNFSLPYFQQTTKQSKKNYIFSIKAPPLRLTINFIAEQTVPSSFSDFVCAQHKVTR